MVNLRFRQDRQERGINKKLYFIIPLAFALLHGISSGVWAQITPDGTLSTTVTPSDRLNIFIDGGTQSGANLFHSFDEFSIPTTGSATFNNAIDIDNIISRVTGNTPSTIDGLLKAQGNANVFLINPNGFLFGPNAELNIGGSFMSTTADRFLFSDGTFFSASDTQPTPLLSIHTPIGLQMGQASSPINIQGTGHSLIQTLDYAQVQQAQVQRPAESALGVQVPSGETLAFIGSGITLDGATLTAPGGHVELGSLSTGRVYFDSDWQFDYQEVTDFQDIRLAQRSLVDGGDRQAGSVHLYGSTVQLESGATILNQQTGSRRGGNIQIQASDAVLIYGTAPGGTPRTQVRTETAGSGTGSAIRIAAPRLQIRGGGGVVSTTFSEAQAGTITIQAVDRIKIAGYSALAPDDTTASSALAALSVGDSGDAGSIRIAAERLTLRNGGSLVSLALLGEGNGGDIDIDASTITVEGISSRAGVAGISSATIGQGNAGSIEIQTDVLRVRDGALIDSSSIAEGNAGNIQINATEGIWVEGFVLTDLNASGIVKSSINSVTSAFSTSPIPLPGVPDTPTGNAGQIQLHTPNLIVENRGQISIRTAGPGDSGEIRIEAERIALNNQGQISATITTGEGGNVAVQTDRLTLNNGLINASVLDRGDGGDITINATESIDVIGAGELAILTTVILPTFTGRFQDIDVNQGIWAIALKNGMPGNITLQTNNLSLSNGSVIAAATFGRQPGGSIRIQDTQSIDIQASVLSSSTFNPINGGNAGAIDIETQRLSIWDGGEIIATTTGAGDGGNLVIDASESIVLQGRSALGSLFASGLFADSQGEATGNGGDLQLKTPLLMVRDDAGLSASSGVSLPPIETLFPQSSQTSSRQRAVITRQGSFAGETVAGETVAQNSSRSIAGTVEVEAGFVLLDQGNITATSNQGEGGNIALDIEEGLLMTRQSSISTRAGTEIGGGGNGGNIAIESPFITALDNSDIVANAFEGDGGSINIETQGLFGLAFRNSLTAQSDINASSEFGLSGNVSITTPDIDPASDAVQLPSTVVEPTQQVSTACSSAAGSRFLMTGKSGIPLGPEGIASGNRPWLNALPDLGQIPDDLRQMPMTRHEQDATSARFSLVSMPQAIEEPVSFASSVQEATGIAIAPNGTPQLVAANSQNTVTPRASCTSQPDIL